MKILDLVLDFAVGNWRLVAAGAVVLAILGYHLHATNRAWHEGYAAHEAEVEVKTEDLNENLHRLAEKHRAATDAYLRKRAEARRLKEKLDDQALASGNADRPALDASSVRRLPRQP